MLRKYILNRTLVNKNTSKFKEQLKAIKAAAVATGPVTGELSLSKKPKMVEGGFKYQATLKLSTDDSVLDTKVDEVLDVAERAARKAAENQKWSFGGTAEQDDVTAEQVNKALDERPPWIAPKMTDEVIKEEFSSIFDREAHFRVLHDATECFVESGGEIRNHTVLFGPPASCKSDMFLAFKQFYEKDTDREILHILDKTAITKAGLENWILDRAEAHALPLILAIEEIEKADLSVLNPLVSIMDGKGVLQKINARVNRKESIKMLVWASCNDVEYLKNFYRGFIWSRFSNQMECVRPSREIMEHKILPIKISQMHGDPRWAKLACDFSYEVLKNDDPRCVISCLTGRDRLLTGQYQQDRLHIINTAKIANQQTARLEASK